MALAAASVLDGYRKCIGDNPPMFIYIITLTITTRIGGCLYGFSRGECSGRIP